MPFPTHQNVSRNSLYTVYEKDMAETAESASVGMERQKTIAINYCDIPF